MYILCKIHDTIVDTYNVHCKKRSFRCWSCNPNLQQQTCHQSSSDLVITKINIINLIVVFNGQDSTDRLAWKEGEFVIYSDIHTFLWDDIITRLDSKFNKLIANITNMSFCSNIYIICVIHYLVKLFAQETHDLVNKFCVRNFRLKVNRFVNSWLSADN